MFVSTKRMCQNHQSGFIPNNPKLEKSKCQYMDHQLLNHEKPTTVPCTWWMNLMDMLLSEKKKKLDAEEDVP